MYANEYMQLMFAIDVCNLSHPIYVYEWSHSIDHANDAWEDKLYNQSNAWKPI